MARIWRSVFLLAVSLAGVIALQLYLDEMMIGLPQSYSDADSGIIDSSADQEITPADEVAPPGDVAAKEQDKEKEVPR